MYTICYVLTDNDALFFYNELLISLRSLRLHMPFQKVCVLMDNTTSNILSSKDRNELCDEFNAECRIITIDDTYSQKEKSRFLKIKIRELLSGDILYIDTDTVFDDKLPEDISPSVLSLAFDLNIHLHDRLDFELLKEMNSQYGYRIETYYEYYNSGVIWAKDTVDVRKFFEKWFDEWEKNRIIAAFDQPSLNYVNCQMENFIQPLKNIYNLQISASPTPIQDLPEAVIIHFLNVVNRSAYLLSNREYLEKPYDSKEILSIIQSPKSAFKQCRIIETDKDLERIFNSWNFRVMVSIYHRAHWLFELFEQLFRVCGRKR